MFNVLRRLWLGLTLIVLTSGFLLMSDVKQRAGASAMPKVALFTFSSLKALDDGVRAELHEYVERRTRELGDAPFPLPGAA